MHKINVHIQVWGSARIALIAPCLHSKVCSLSIHHGPVILREMNLMSEREELEMKNPLSVCWPMCGRMQLFSARLMPSHQWTKSAFVLPSSGGVMLHYIIKEETTKCVVGIAPHKSVQGSSQSIAAVMYIRLCLCTRLSSSHRWSARI